MNSDLSHAETIEPTYDDRVVAAALASLPGIGPQRLRTLMRGLGVLPAWQVVRGEAPAPEHIAAMLRQDG
ncbi:MAG: hypothetical protein EB143_08265, partial [Actinobacteria bacterium]|nr:hypothetical protein [Actinomycetota bacterium]